MKIDWDQFDQDATEIDLRNNDITEINWEGCPLSVKWVDFSSNQISEMIWKGCPKELQTVHIHNNKLNKLSFDGCPQSLEAMSVGSNDIISVDWEQCPDKLLILPSHFYCDFQDYKEQTRSLEYIKNYSKKFRPITDQINHLSLVNPEDSKFPVVQKYCGTQFKEFVKEAQEFDLIN